MSFKEGNHSHARVDEAVPTYVCADDLMRAVLKSLLASPARFTARRGEGRHILGVSLRLSDPRARLSRSEMRGKVYSALGEFVWCLAGSDELDFIKHYIPKYPEFGGDAPAVQGAYGPRIFGKGVRAQVWNVVNLLRQERKRFSRQAVIQIFASTDLESGGDQVPCTCTLQLIRSDDCLNMIVYMRSNDAYLGLPHDIFVFTMIQELMARALNIELGFYQHMVGHLHLYDNDSVDTEAYLGEGVQTIGPMPPMPAGDPAPVVSSLVSAEASIRRDPGVKLDTTFESYWEDILRLLRIQSERHHRTDGYRERIDHLKAQISSDVFRPYLM